MLVGNIFFNELLNLNFDMSPQEQVGQLPAFKDDPLLHLLDEVGLRDRYEERKLRCFDCNQNLAEIEVGAFLNRNGLMEPVCTAP